MPGIRQSTQAPIHLLDVAEVELQSGVESRIVLRADGGAELQRVPLAGTIRVPIAWSERGSDLEVVLYPTQGQDIPPVRFRTALALASSGPERLASPSVDALDTHPFDAG